jgi:hypothetical protein
MYGDHRPGPPKLSQPPCTPVATFGPAPLCHDALVLPFLFTDFVSGHADDIANLNMTTSGWLYEFALDNIERTRRFHGGSIR